MPLAYPLVNISLDWKEAELPESLYLDNDLYLSSDEDYFQRYFLNEYFVDAKLEVFKITGKQKAPKWWSKLFFMKRYTLQFEATGQQILLEKVRSHLLNQLEKYPVDDKDEQSLEWKEGFKRAIEEGQTTEEMFHLK